MKKTLIINSNEVEIDLNLNLNGKVEFSYNGRPYSFTSQKVDEVKSYITGDLNTFVSDDGSSFIVNGREMKIESPLRSRSKSRASSGGHMQSPMPGKILQVLVNAGDQVKAGDSLIVMEAMKMEHTIKANANGVVKAVNFTEGQQCAGGVDLVDFEAEDE